MNRLKKLRQKNNLTLKELGKKVDMLDSTLSQYENGKRNPNDKVWQKLADYFNVSVHYIRRDIDKELIAKIIKLLLNFIDPSMDFLIDGKAVPEENKALYEEMLLITLIDELGLDTEQIVEELKQEMWKSEFIKVLSEYGSEDTIKGGIKLVKLYDQLIKEREHE